MNIHLVCAARPNFMKIAPLYHALLAEEWTDPVIVHTGQHYDANMSDAFFEDLGLPKPHIYLEVGSGSHAEQTGRVMIAYEKVLMEKRPDLIVVVGDVNSTMAATLVASKCGIKVAHLEAGLRSYDRRMPEEINRIVTDALADILWVPSRDAIENLIKEGVPSSKILLVGNIMMDSLEMMRGEIESQDVSTSLGLEAGNYGVVTMHRPSNVDDPGTLKKLCLVLMDIAREVPLVFPLHPRTRKNMERNGLLAMMEGSEGLHMPEPLNYIRFMNLVFNSKFAITDSGGLQEETTYLGIPCLTVRENTERPITITQGTNRLCDLDQVKGSVEKIRSGEVSGAGPIEFWDGCTAKRIVETLKRECGEARECCA